MPTGSESLSGPRLEFVVRKLPGTIVRNHYTPPPTKRQIEKNPDLETNLSNTIVETVEDAGFMVYFPTGNCYRLSAEQLVARGFDREPTILSFDQANSTDTAAGRFKLARNDQVRQKAWKELEEGVIRACMRGSGDLKAFVADYDPKGKLPEREAA